LLEVRLAPNPLQILQFLEQVKAWAADEANVRAVALAGSHARNEATETSDLDLVIIAREPQTYLQRTQWAERFGTIDHLQLEDYGKVTSLRVWYSSGYEVEYGFTDETWVALPLDEGTRQVLSDGIQIIFERETILSRLKQPK
jgi:predicted nucleotidyltransferase